MRVQEDVTLSVSPDRVWSVLADWERYPEWMRDVALVRALGPERGQGMRLAVRTKVLGVPALTDVLYVTAWEPPRRMRIAHEGLVRGRGEWLLEEFGAGTRFRWTEDLTMSPPILGPLALAVYSPVLRWNIRRTMDNLRRLVEAA